MKDTKRITVDKFTTEIFYEIITKWETKQFLTEYCNKQKQLINLQDFWNNFHMKPEVQVVW